MNNNQSNNHSTASQWQPSRKKHPCPLCGNTSGWCSTSIGDSAITCKNTTTAPSGWICLKETKDGGGVYKPEGDRPSVAPVADKQSPAYSHADHETRDSIYRGLIATHGKLDANYRLALTKRGLTEAQIDRGVERGYFANWIVGHKVKYDSTTHNVAGIHPVEYRAIGTTGLFLPAVKDGHIVGGQIHPKDHTTGKKTDIPKYIWLSSSKHGGVNAWTSDTHENPLFLREYHQPLRLDDVININLCEGALKSAIAWLQFNDRGQTDPFLGAAGGQFSEAELNQYLDRYPNLETVTIWPDGGDVMNQSVLDRWRKTCTLVTKTGKGVMVAWWGQATKEANDVDELTAEDLEKLTIKPWGKSVMGTELTEAEPAEQQELRPYFDSDPDRGLWRNDPDGEGGWRRTRIGNHLKAIARVNNPTGDGAALQLEFKSTNGRMSNWTMARADLAGEGSSIISGLMQRDYGFKRRQKNLLLDYLHELGNDVEKTYTITDSSGWVGSSFVMPDRTYGDADLKFRDVEPSPEALTEITGTLEGWQAGIGAKCAGNSRLIFALGAAFAAPLLPLVGIESGGFHLVGGTSIGKTTILRVASSIVGIKDIPHWRMTSNGLESIATASNHMLLPLDEIGQADPKDVGNSAYMLANGQGKARMTKNLTSRKGKTWLLMVLSTGEVELGAYMAQAGIMQKGGQEVRLPNIPAMPQGKPFGCFENIHGAETPQQFVAGLEESARDHHGMVMDKYLSKLVVEAADPFFAGQLAKRVREIESLLLKSQSTGDSAIGRVAKRLALVYVGLELAHSYELLKWNTDQIPWAVSTIFRDWFEARGGAGSIEVKQACDRIEQLLRANEYGDRIYTLPSNDGRQVRNLLGYRVIDSNKHSKTFGQTQEFLIPSIIFDNELATHVNKGELIAELQRRSLLTQPRSDGKNQIQRRVNGQREYFYVFPWSDFRQKSSESVS